MRIVQCSSRPRVLTLQDLIAEARAYADASFRVSGEVQPTLLALTPGGVIAHYPGEFASEADKERFVLECRLLLIASEATMSAMILESWILMLKEGELPSIAPSESPERIEVVTVCAESREEQRFLTLPILRTSLGLYSGLGDDTAPAGLTAQGRFTQLLPPKVPNAEDVQNALSVLKTMRITIAAASHGFSTS